MADIEAGEVPQPTNINVGFPEQDADEADIERQLLDAEKNGTTLGEIEDAKQKKGVEEVKPDSEEAKDGDGKDTKEGEEKKPDNSETPAEKEKRELARDEKTGKFVKSDSQYEKAKKDAVRKDTSWKALNEEKAQARAEAERKQAELQRERQELEYERTRMQQQAANRGEYSPQEYHKGAQEFQAAAFKALSEGDAELAQKHFADANQCMQAAQRTWEYLLVQNREKDVRDTIKANPELDDINSEAGQAMLRLLKENPYLAQLPNGFSKGVQFLKATRDAARVPELEGKLSQAITERDEARAQLKAATSLAGAGTQSQPGARNFDDMSDREQKHEVERMFDSNGEFVHQS